MKAKIVDKINNNFNVFLVTANILHPLKRVNKVNKD